MLIPDVIVVLTDGARGVVDGVRLCCQASEPDQPVFHDIEVRFPCHACALKSLRPGGLYAPGS